MPSARQHCCIRREIEQQHQASQNDLRAAGQSGGIQRRPDVMLDKSAAVSSFAASHPQCNFERCQRANPAGVFDQHAPERGGKVYGCHPPPAQDEKSSENYKENERQVEYEYEIR